MAKYIYIINEKDKNYCKIGYSKNPKSRLKTSQTYHPNDLNLYYTEFFDDEKKIKEIEKVVHHNLKHKNIKGEWFNINPEDAKLEIIHAKILYEDADTNKLKV